MNASVTVTVSKGCFGKVCDTRTYGIVGRGIYNDLTVITALGNRTVLQDRGDAACKSEPIIWIIIYLHLTAVATIADDTACIGGGGNTAGTAFAARASCLYISCVFRFFNN